MKILVVGCGSIGKRHLCNLRNLGYTDLLVCRSRYLNVRAIECEFEVRSYFSLDEALDQQPDAVLVTNPTAFHVPVALAAAERGCHLFVEKPVSHSLDGTDKLLALVEQRGLVAMVGYNLRFHPALQALHEMVVREEIGKILSVRAWASQYLPDWHPGEDYRQSYVARADLGGGVILTLSHELDYLHWLFGELLEVTALASQPSTFEMSTESLAEIILVFKNGVTAQVHLDCLQRTPSRGCELIGSEGTIRCDLNRSEIRLYRAAAVEPTIVPASLDDPNQMYLDEISRFLDCVRSGKQPIVSLEEGIAVLKIALTAHRAAATGVMQRWP